MSNVQRFARASAMAYVDNATETFAKMKFRVIQYVDHKGAQCYLLEDKDLVLLVFRGTEPKEFSDIKADLNAIQRDSKAGTGDVHSGFANEVDKIFEKLELPNQFDKPFYLAGHSLGAAMATIASHRLQDKYKISGLYTYGSPRAGDSDFVKSLKVPHWRVKNNNDLVTTVPFWIMGYRHHGKLVYINYYGQVRKMTSWQRWKDQWRGRFKAWSKFQLFDGAYDHSITKYVRALKDVVLSD
jgi:triacylglycerol lipase